jgi:ferrochelatase
MRENDFSGRGLTRDRPVNNPSGKTQGCSMSGYHGESGFQHDEHPAVGILLTNVGTPDAPDTPSLRHYLAQFLSDPRVIEPPPARWLWKIILHGIILNTRPRKSAALYRNIWTDDGSPLLVHSRKQAAGVQTLLRKCFGGPVHVEAAMGYGNPSVAQVLDNLKAKHCRKLFILPLFPQYSSATTGSTFDAVGNYFQGQRWIPELRFNTSYHDHPLYIEALSNSVREYRAEEGEPSRTLISFHGLPLRYVRAGDPYHCHCMKTGRLLIEELGAGSGEIFICFQSLFGKEQWLQPYTDKTLIEWAKQGITNIHTVCPGFSSDCIETLEEMDITNREFYEQAGGGDFHYIPALNEREGHLKLLAAICAEKLSDWLVPLERYDAGAENRRTGATCRHYEALKTDSPNT